MQYLPFADCVVSLISGNTHANRHGKFCVSQKEFCVLLFLDSQIRFPTVEGHKGRAQ